VERDNEEDTDKSSAVIVTGAPVSDSADEGHSSLIAAPPSTASVAASFRDGSKDDEVVAVTNATRVDVYFRTAYLLHYASIVILGLFVLQVTCFRAHARKLYLVINKSVLIPVPRLSTRRCPLKSALPPAAIGQYVRRRRPGCDKPLARRCRYRSTGHRDRQTDGQTDSVPLHRCSPLEATSIATPGNHKSASKEI